MLEPRIGPLEQLDGRESPRAIEPSLKSELSSDVGSKTDPIYPTTPSDPHDAEIK
jgi:hypothetical protein